jgi:hypothetical protein
MEENMPKYNVYVVVDAGFSLDVIEANSAEEAADIARDSKELSERNFHVCHQCSGNLDVGDMYKLVIGEAGGTKTEDFDL